MELTVTLEDGTSVEIDEGKVKLPTGVSFLKPGTIPEGYIAIATVEQQKTKAVEDAISARFGNHVSRDKAALDAKVIEAVLKAHKGDKDVDLEAYATKLRADEVAPLTAKLETLRTTVRSTSIRDAARSMGFEDKLLISPNGGISYAEHLLDPFADSDPDSGEVYFALKGQDGKLQRVPGAAGQSAFLPLREAGEQLRAIDGFADFFKDPQAQGGSGHKGGEGSKGGGKKVMKRDTFEALGAIEKAKFMSDGGKLTD